MIRKDLPKPNTFISQFWAVTKKEIKIQIRYPLSFVSNFVEIFMMILIFTFVARIFINPSVDSTTQTASVSSNNLSTYMVLGLMAFLFFRDAVTNLGQTLRNEQTTGTLETLFLYPINHLANLMGKMTWSIFLNTFLVLFGVITLSFVSGEILISFPGIIYGLLIFLMYLMQIFGFTFFLAGLNLKLKESILPLTNFLEFFLMLLGAFFFPYSALGPLVIISYFIPFSYTIDLMRTTIFGTNPELATIAINTTSLGIELIAIQWLFSITLTIVLPILGYKFFKRTINQSRALGTLSDY